MEFSLSQLETRGLDLTCFFDSILETLSRVSFPVDGGTKHSGSRHASRRLRAALSLRMLESRFTSRVVEPGRERERETWAASRPDRRDLLCSAGRFGFVLN